MKKNSSTKRAIKLEPAAVEPGFTIEFASLLKKAPRLFRLAIKEAEAIAWQTPFPHLVIPALMQEKLRSAERWHNRQQSLRHSDDDDEMAFAA
jgi:hypothetical protein